MKLAKTSKEEILALLRVLNEVEMLRRDLRQCRFPDLEWEDYEVLDKMGLRADEGQRDPEAFIEDLARHLSRIHFQRILFNCETLLDHCADPDRTTLEYNPDITKGLELLREWVDAEPGRRLEFPVQRLAHSDLDRIGDSAHTSQCPDCTPGTLVMQRDPKTMELLPEDACLHCGQRVVYTDVVEGVIVEQEN